MSLRAFKLAWWPLAVFPLLFFCLGLCLLPYPGLQNDEVLFANALFHVPASDKFHIDLLQYRIPLMLMTYLGALKTWLYAPILALTPPSYWAVRLPVLVLGALTTWLFIRLLDEVHGRRAAWMGGLLLATDTSFLLTTCFDWGPVVLQHLLPVSGMLLLWRFSHAGRGSALFWGFFCLGLAMWDKAVFGWMLGGLVVATLAIFPQEIRKRLTWKTVLLAGAGFCIGALPLLAYNVTSGFSTFRSNSFAFDEFRTKAWTLRNTWNGSALFGYFAEGYYADHAREAQGPLEQVSFKVYSFLGDHARNRMEGASYVALALAAALWFTRVRRMLLFALLAIGIAWLQMAITKGAGKAAHHVVLLWPLPHFFLAITFAEISTRLRRVGSWVIAAGVLYLAAENLLVTNQYLYQLARYGPANVWSDAIYKLSYEVGRRQAPHIVIDDWGIVNQLVLLHRGELSLEFAGDDFLYAGKSDDQKKWDRGLLEQALWIGHMSPFELFAGTDAKIVKAASSAGFRKEVLKVIADTHGRPVFEIFRFVPAQPTS